MVNSCVAEVALQRLAIRKGGGRTLPAPKHRTRKVEDKCARIGSPDAAQRTPGNCQRSLDTMSQCKTCPYYRVTLLPCCSPKDRILDSNRTAR